MLTDESRQRDFPSLANKTYLNTAAEGIPPQVVVEALAHYSRDKQLGMDGRLLHEAQWRAARQEVAAAMGLEPDDIAICSCSSEAFNLAALALRLREGDEVVINDLDFPAGVTPWLQPNSPATIRLWKSQNGSLPVERLRMLLNARTKLVSISLVSFYNGYKIDLAEVVDVVRKHSPALVTVDVTQALGRCVVSLSSADLLVSSTHKWLLATHGGGLVGVPKANADRWTVPAGGWFNQQDPFGADRFDRAASKRGAASFCVGMPNYPAVYAIAASMAYLREITVAAIEAHTAPLVRFCLDELKRLPVEVLTPDQPNRLAGILAFRHPQAEQIHARLRSQNIHVMHNAGRLRLSLHGYNTMQDVEHFLSSLHEAVHYV